jgi:uncharacterized protein HemY
MPTEQIGRGLILAGVVVVIVGVVFLAAGRIPWLGRLPGDFTISRDNVTIYVPIATSILLSIILTVIASFFFRR